LLRGSIPKDFSVVKDQKAVFPKAVREYESRRRRFSLIALVKTGSLSTAPHVTLTLVLRALAGGALVLFASRIYLLRIFER
jgi:hypothetical protein